MNFLEDKKKLILKIIAIFLILVLGISFFDRGLANGVAFIIFLAAITFFVLFKIGINNKELYLLFIITLLIRLGAVLFIHYADFQPFSGGYGDYVVYQKQAQEIAQAVGQGNFSLKGLSIGLYYPVVIGYIYALTMPEMLIGRLFGVWLAAISVLFVYLIVLEIGGTRKWAFLIGLIIAIYPSYLFFGSLLLKDTLIIPLVLAGLLLILKLIKNFLWRNFIFFYVILGATIHFRFYIGYAVLFTFIFCWLLLCKLQIRKKLVCGIIMISLLGFLPQFLGYGYYGYKTIKGYLNQKTITFYREIVYASIPSSAVISSEILSPETPNPKEEGVLKKLLVKVFPNIGKASDTSYSSTIEVKTDIDDSSNFLINYSKSFICVLLGPLPWHIQNYRQLFVLFETIPWYFLLFFIGKGVFVTLKDKRIALPLLVFSAISLGVLALFISNFGIITRIRIPSFIALLCLISLGFEKSKSIKIL
ncbi:MAG: hypothetical protein COU42_01465 [Candidatus Nealsonbacteria bacterium CG10_big_fil_rev_8_21_14_0_10_36_24]|uniref:Glycosyltransferase RgtA/B/C/D-like domain-containing protein n=2 Tax=Candidatus Nealsoniibacteriota TaxID=1817911 RepID=A0A2H0YQQ0_9BACT|nr:MAG: hypothetical protein COU42_01465 [Candidatus Nealsonbacteria bacterium CG10_big_fil_rev_8_21_14_0_10_36_24]PIS40072.1 MAG: hypothetical protein COT32_01640 [Candidatus Nealsonbacteria bacterium CG08_land_8_20_14_0_20_36_22]